MHVVYPKHCIFIVNVGGLKRAVDVLKASAYRPRLDRLVRGWLALLASTPEIIFFCSVDQSHPQNYWLSVYSD